MTKEGFPRLTVRVQRRKITTLVSLLIRGEMVKNLLEYANRIIASISVYSIYEGKYYIISAYLNYNQ